MPRSILRDPQLPSLLRLPFKIHLKPQRLAPIKPVTQFKQFFQLY